MPEFTGRLRTPRLAAAPATPVAGEIYYDTAVNKLYWWDGTTWVPAMDAGGSGGSGGSSPGAPIVRLNPTGPGDFTPPTAATLVPGLSHTITVAGRYKIDVVIDGVSAGATTAIGYLYKNGAVVGSPAFVFQPPSTSRYDTIQTWTLDLIVGDVIALYAYANPVNTFTISYAHSSMTIYTTQGPKGDKGDVGGNATVPIEAWHTVGAAGEPAYSGSWGPHGAGGYAAKFRKRPDGIVELSGMARGGATGSTIFTLPAGYWPDSADFTTAGALYFPTMVSDAYKASVQVTSTGAVQVGSGTVVGGDWVSFQGIRFPSAQTTFPTGPKGDQGVPGGTIGASYALSSSGAPVSIPNGNWALLPLPDTGMDISTTAGVPDFERMSDGSLRVVTDGIYDVVGTLGMSDQVPAGILIEARLAVATAATPTSGQSVAIANETTGVASYPCIPVSGAIKLVANQRIALLATQGYVAGGSARYGKLYYFSIARSGGPKGDKGDTGGNATVPIEDWHVVGAAGEPAFLNNWVAFDATRSLPSFRKMPDGTVRLRGVMKPNVATTGQTICFTLPVGYRPLREMWFNQDSSIDNASKKIRVEVGSSGGINITGSAPLGVYVSLDGISFTAEDVPVTAMPTGPAGPAGPKGDYVGMVSDPGYVKSTGTVSQASGGNGVIFILNAAGMPYLDLPAGTWFIRGAASTYANVMDYVQATLWNETDSVVIPNSAGAGSVNGPTSPGVYADAIANTVVKLTKTTRIRIRLVPSGASTITVNTSSVATTSLEAWQIGPGPQGIQGAKGDKGDPGGLATKTPAYTLSGFGTIRTISGSSYNMDTLATVLATLITDLKTAGVVGP